MTPSAADAAEGNGYWYATGALGAAFSSSQTLDYSSQAGAASASASFEPGLLAGGAVGYAFNPSWRVEGEFIYQSVEHVGAGLALLTEFDIERGGDRQSYSGDGFGVQLLASARYEVGERCFVDAGVRYLTAGEVDLDGEGATDGRIKADYEPWAATLSVGWRL